MKSCNKWYLDARFGMFIHFGLYSILARGEWSFSRYLVPEEEYNGYFDEFNPVEFDAREWARIAKNAGMKYAVLTVKHHEGFCLFDTALTDFKVTNSPFGRDIVREYVEAFRAEGIKVGLYYSLLDWHHPDYPIDRFHPLRDTGIVRPPDADFSRYVDYLHGQVSELLTNYGEIDILWLDFSYDDMSGETWRANELCSMIRQLQPNIIMNNRLVTGHTSHVAGEMLGDIATPEQIIPAEGIRDSDGNPILWESCETINGQWGYCTSDSNYKSAKELVRYLVECVSKDGNFLLNIGPNPKGAFPKVTRDILAEIGEWMSENGESIYGCGSAGMQKPQWGMFTKKDNRLYAHMFDRPSGPLCVYGLGGKVKKARMANDWSVVPIIKPWNAPDREQDIFVDLPHGRLVDPTDTVVMLELA